MGAFPWRLLTVDIDGTLTRVHGWEAIADAFGRRPEYDRTQQRFFAREIGEDEHLTDLLDLASGRTVAEVEAVVARTPVLSGVTEGIEKLHRLGARVALLTHNPTYVVDYYRRTYGFDDGEGIRAQSTDGGRIGPPRHVVADKPGELRALLARMGIAARSVAHVGDGWSDAEVFALVGGGIALNSRLEEVNRAADRVLTTQDFGAVVEVLGTMTPRR
jgi:HAD superfamily phosphoserine phosphatase-like hydrolase